MMEIDPAEFQERLGLEFNDKSLLIRALTHPSFLNEHAELGVEDNQRLEFLGDAVLDFISGELLYHRFPEASEGRLTRLRAALVRTETLAHFSQQKRIDECLLLGHGEEDSGGRGRATNLAAVFEAVTGALYLDQNMVAVQAYVEPLFNESLDDIVRLELDKDAKSRLQEWAQAHHSLTPTYEVIETRGPDHAKEFTIAVYIGDEEYARGDGPSKQTAAQRAARRALELLTASSEL